MKKILIGLAIGIVLCGLACFFIIPGIRETAYNSGFDAGNKKGVSTGTVAGIAKGIAQVREEQKQEQDRIAAEEKNKAAAMQKVMHRPRKVVKEVQNWHVIDGKIADPIPG
jgi:hypothetical protein